MIQVQVNIEVEVDLSIGQSVSITVNNLLREDANPREARIAMKVYALLLKGFGNAMDAVKAKGATTWKDIPADGGVDLEKLCSREMPAEEKGGKK